MIVPAYIYKDEINKLYAQISMDDKYKFMHYQNYFSFNLKIDDSSWNQLQVVSVLDNEIIGFFSASFNRIHNKAEQLFTWSYGTELMIVKLKCSLG